MLNSFQHLIKSTGYETLNQVQGDTKRFGQQTLGMGQLRLLRDIKIRSSYPFPLKAVLGKFVAWSWVIRLWVLGYGLWGKEIQT